MMCAFLHCYYHDIYGIRPVEEELRNTVVWLSCGFDRPPSRDVIVGLVDAVLNQRTDPELFSEVLTEPCTVKSSIGGEDLQLARVPAGKLLADIGVTPFPSGRAVQVKDSVRLCIDEFRGFEILYFVFRLIAVRAARRRPLEECGVNSSDRSSVVKISGLLEKGPASRHPNSIESET